MIQTTRLATDQEKSIIIAYLQKTTSHPTNSDFFAWSNTGFGKENDWNLASFIVLEVKDLEEKIVVVNQVIANAFNTLDIATTHYLLDGNNEITDISNPSLYL